MKSRAPWVFLAIIGILVSGPGHAGQATIFDAAQTGDIEAVTRLLKADPKLVEAKNDEGDTALHQAAGCRRGEEAALPLVRLLLEAGAAVEARNTSGQTPLLYASYAGFRRVVELLVAKGAVVKYQDTNGRSPLHYAAREGHPAVVELLLKNGADPAAKDGQNRTPLDYAVLRDRRAVVEAMMKLVSFDIKGADGSTLLHAAAAQGNIGMVEDLLARGADPARPAPDGGTILLSYLRGGLAAKALEEIGRGADVRVKTGDGTPALHLAVKKGLEEVVAALLAKGADPGAADGTGVTALDISMDLGYPSVAALLKGKGAKPSPPMVYRLKPGAHEIVPSAAVDAKATAIVRYIGTDGFLIEAGSKTVLIDGLVRNPWGYPDTPQRALDLMKAGEPPFGRLDLLLFSHAHRDHFEPSMALEVMAAQPKAWLVGDGLVTGELEQAGPDALAALGPRVRTIGLKIGEKTVLSANGIPLTVLGINHADTGRPYLTLGYIMDLGPFRVYHQGDIFPDANLVFLSSFAWEELKIDIAFFDPFFLQNEAARRLALERIRPSAIILMHMRDGEGERYSKELKPAVPQVLFFRSQMESKRFVKTASAAINAGVLTGPGRAQSE
jgi:ankyrin repeat protein/L-ascorbate metabolism protein UlaG (beta-lactamase superfamily)